jgi:hypothetical protein
MKIDHNIPVPETRRPGSIMEVLEKMAIGDSVVLPISQIAGWYLAAKRMKMRVTQRPIDRKQSRVWRVA